MGTNKNWRKYEYRTEVQCSDCGKVWMKLTATLKQWKGYCLQCSPRHREFKDTSEERATMYQRLGLKARHDILGRTFNRWTVIKDIGVRRDSSGYRRHWWRCRCECGTVSEVLQASLVTNHSKSCGCHKREVLEQKALIHGHNRKNGQRSRAYNTWDSMIQRCTNPNSTARENYGSRGITVCDEWKDFRVFIRDMGNPPQGGTIERIDNDLGYFPGNCRWATRREQARNKRTTHLITHHGRTMCVTDWADLLDIPRARIYSRLQDGWSTENALDPRTFKKDGSTY